MTTALLAATLCQGGWAADARDARKLKSKVAPVYPELARQLNVSGTVRMQIVISTEGKVKSMRPVGGHPLLIKSASEALKDWRYEPGTEQTVVIEFHFSR